MMNWWVSNSRREAVASRGFFAAHKWWMLRRATQILVMTTFMLGPMAGIWIVKGNFASSELLGVLDLADPYMQLQGLVAGWPLAAPALIGAGIITLFYLIIGGRAYCSWVCPVNAVTDTAHWLREKLGLTRDRKLDKRTRYLLLVGTLLAAFITGTLAWELVNPVSIMQRGLIFGVGLGWGIVLLVFLLDLLVSRRAWCSHLCPVGAFYGLIGRFSFVRISARNREDCNSCGACLTTCPEPHVIVPALKGDGSTLVLSGDCINCGGCIDSCPNKVFSMATRLRP
ncbi:quinol dehydrogenase ferredoxin subunit NapH [Paracoccus sulfuroxidans]|uniref:Ferredoxin-type protein NapH n=1 Tax=Paracoccus sulfuroxidans TaxID=384678 RepID=A0A562NSI0_9RHOB|nr:quinol dehydrogenase ferredoxin subunit NapH [Paracoccus sulfuroxidans]TWI35164.1 ferredoxin-type protein NapH [Paracoccus sulfuroxidans]